MPVRAGCDEGSGPGRTCLLRESAMTPPATLLLTLLLGFHGPVADPGASPRDTTRASPPGAVDPQEVRFRNGDLTLGGLWFVPEGEGPFPAAVFIRGSGPSSRQNHWARALVDVLLDTGIAVLLPDKRGSDASEGDWRTASFEDLAGDALAGVEFVRSRPEVAADRVGLVGLSQGGRIAPLAASRSQAIAFVVNIVGAATDLKEQVSWEMYHTFREAGVDGAALQDALTLQVLAEGYVEGIVEWREYEAALHAALAGPAADVARGFPASPDAWQWAFFRRVLDDDPVAHWRRVRQPVLVLYGEEDRNAPTIRAAYRLIRVWREMEHPDATLRVIPGTGHALWAPGSDPHHPSLHPAVVATLREWLETRTKAPSSAPHDHGR